MSLKQFAGVPIGLATATRMVSVEPQNQEPKVPIGKRRILGATVLAVFGLLTAAVDAATVVMDGTNALSIQGLVTRGAGTGVPTEYNVTFSWTTGTELYSRRAPHDPFGSPTPFLYDNRYAGEALAEVVDLLNEAGAITVGPNSDASFLLPVGAYTYGDELRWWYHYTGSAFPWAGDDPPWTATIAWGNSDPGVRFSFAEFEFVGAPVPIPPAVWLFGSALGVMGLMRRIAIA
jgi:hypothetical protein